MSEPAPSRRRSGRTPSRLSLWIAATLLLGGFLGLWALKPQADSRLFSGPNPVWIWDSDWPADPVRAHAFTVEREFEVPEVPKTARLLISADEEYQLEINGEWVGAGQYRSGTSWDLYRVAPHLRVGKNQLKIGLRSSRGVGGLLLCLQARLGQTCWVASDRDWRVTPLDGRPDRPVEAWGAAPIANWPLPQGVQPRHRADECFLRHRPVEAKRSVPIEDRRIVLPAGEELFLPVFSVRWGPRALGLIEVDVDPALRNLGVLAYGRNRGRSAPREQLETLITEPGQSTYRSAAARQLRFVEVDGLQSVPGGRYHPLHDRCTDWVFEEAAPREGLFGLEIPPSRSPVEYELRGDL